MGDWLAEQPDPTNVDVLSWYSAGPLSYHFPGRVVGFSYGSRMPWLDVDYVVLYINQVQRDIPTAAAVDYFLEQTPVYTATLEGVPMAMVYNLNQIVADLSETAPPPQPIQVTAQWPEVSLVAMRTHTNPSIGTALPVEMEWSGTPARAAKVSLRLIGTDGTLVAQQDVSLQPEMKVSLFVPPDAVPGDYALYMMVYDSDTLDPVRTLDGQDLIITTPVQVSAPKATN
ncbi:MAG: hypothetical protein IPK16_03260 [Anaerolineales bacterium]|nr:hypothetical protein [Anaerolineales bacterium]